MTVYTHEEFMKMIEDKKKPKEMTTPGYPKSITAKKEKKKHAKS